MLALTLDKLDGLPDNLKGAYVAKDGKFVLDVEIPDVTAERAKVVEAERKLTAATKATQTASDLAAETQRKLDAALATRGDTDKNVTELLAKWEIDKNKAVADAVAAEKATHQPIADRLTVFELDNALAEAHLKHGGRPEKKASMLKIAKHDWSLVDGKPVIKDAKGEVTTKSLDDYFSKDYKTAEPDHYTGTKAAGGGAGGHQLPSAGVAGAPTLDQVLKSPSSAITAANTDAATK